MTLVLIRRKTSEIDQGRRLVFSDYTPDLKKRARNILKPEKTRKKTRPIKINIMEEIFKFCILATILARDTI